MGDHPREILVGKRIPAGRPTLYLCWHNHHFVIHGPHLFCKCAGAKKAVLIAKPREHCGCEHRRGDGRGYGHHKHPDGTEGYTRSDSDYILCECGAAPKKLLTRDPKRMDLAEAAYRIGGLRAMLPILHVQHLAKAQVINRYESDYEAPIDFPPGV